MTHHMPRPLRRTAAAALASLAALAFQASQAAMVVDPVGDFAAAYVASGRPTGGDLDVVSAEMLYTPALHQFKFVATMAAAIGSTAAIGSESPLYVWGIDRGTGTERLLGGSPAAGDGVAFDAVLLMNALTGGVTVNLFGLGGPAVTLPGAVTVDGATISTTIDEALLPSRGLALSQYSWNLWPRFGGGSNAQISDFIPDESAGAPNAGNAVVTTVPEPSTLALLALPALAAGALARRRATTQADTRRG